MTRDHVSLNSIVKHFESLPDPRHTCNRLHLLADVISIAVCGMIVGCSGPSAIERWAKAKKEWLKEVLALPNGIPSRDCIRRILSALKPAAFQKCFQEWIAACLLCNNNDMYRTIADLGKLLGRDAEASAMIDGIKTELAKVSVRVENRPRPRVLFTLRSPLSLTSVLTAGRDTFVSELIEIAGGDNVFAGGGGALYPGVSLEEIVGRDPQVIIEAMTSDTIDANKRVDLIEQWQALGLISAVRNERIHFVTDGHFTIPSQRVTLTAWKMLEMIHPERAPHE